MASDHAPPTPIVELSVLEAYTALLHVEPSLALPPIDAIENEDWGRDYVLTRLYELRDVALAVLGLCRASTTSQSIK